MPICLAPASGCFCTVAAELNSWDQDLEVCKVKNIYSLAPYRESLLAPFPTGWFHYYPHLTDEEMEAESYKFGHSHLNKWYTWD